MVFGLAHARGSVVWLVALAVCFSPLAALAQSGPGKRRPRTPAAPPVLPSASGSFSGATAQDAAGSAGADDGDSADSTSASTSGEFDFAWLGRVLVAADGLESSEGKVRRQAVAKLGTFAITYSKTHLLRALNDPDRNVRYEAGRILGRHRVTEAVGSIIGWLDEPDSAAKQDAAELLGLFATADAVAALIRSLGDVDYRVRQRSVVSLGMIGTTDVIVPIIGRLDDDKFEVRKAAVEELERLGDRRAVISLVGAFNDPSMEVRKAAVRAVGKLRDHAAVPALMRLLGESVEELKREAAAALGHLRATVAVDLLIAELESGGSDGFLAEVTYALGRIARARGEELGHGDPSVGQPVDHIDHVNGDRAPDTYDDVGGTGYDDPAHRAVAALVKALADRALRPAAREALRHAGPVAVPALVAHLDSDSGGDPPTAVALLRDIADPRATPALLNELERGRVHGSLVLKAIERTADRRALLPLLGLLETRNSELRLQAMEALRPIIDDLRAADIIAGLLDDEDLEVQVLAAEYLGLMRARQAVPRLLTRLDDTPIRLRMAIVDALGEIADPRATDQVLAILENGPDTLHVSAANALIYIGNLEATAALMALLRRHSGHGRAQAVRALGGIMRDRRHPEVRQLLEELVRDSDVAVALAAISALGAMGDSDSVDALIDLLSGDGHRRRAAAIALGDLAGDLAGPRRDERRRQRALHALLASLDTGDDRVAGNAAWALGKFAAPQAIPALFAATKRRGWSLAINASAALARYAGGEHAEAFAALLYHRNRLVRVNAAMALGRLQSAPARPLLLKLLARDRSALVRVACARALSLFKQTDEAATESLRFAARHDPEPAVRGAAQAAMDGPFRPPSRSDWRDFYIVDAERANAPVSQAGYFLLAADGLATALYADVRGRIGEESFPPGDYVLAPQSMLRHY